MLPPLEDRSLTRLQGAGTHGPACGEPGTLRLRWAAVQDPEVGLLPGREEMACASPAPAQSCPGHGLCASPGVCRRRVSWDPAVAPCCCGFCLPSTLRAQIVERLQAWLLGRIFLLSCIGIKPFICLVCFPHITEQVSGSWGTLTRCSTTSLHSDPIGLELASAPAAGGLRPQDLRPQRPRTGSVVSCASDQ